MLSAKYTEQMPLLVLIYNYRLLFAFGENAFLFEFGENTLLFVFEKIRCCSLRYLRGDASVGWNSRTASSSKRRRGGTALTPILYTDSHKIWD